MDSPELLAGCNLHCVLYALIFPLAVGDPVGAWLNGPLLRSLLVEGLVWHLNCAYYKRRAEIFIN